MKYSYKTRLLVSFILNAVLISSGLFGQNLKPNKNKSAYLAAYMKGDDEHHLYYSVAEKDFIFKELNTGKPILSASYNDKLIRDPMIFCDTTGIYHLVATVSWKNRPFTIWDSKDLVHWKNERLIDVAPENATKSWAPEIGYDRQNGNYFVYWTGETNNDWSTAAIYYSTTTDFNSFSKPHVLYKDTIGILDANIVFFNGVYRLLYRKNGVWVATSSNALGPYSNPYKLSDENVEGPFVFPLRDKAGFGIVWDYFGKSLGYGLLTSDDFTTWTRITNEHYPYYNNEVTFPPGVRHGSVLSITNKQLKELKKAFDK